MPSVNHNSEAKHMDHTFNPSAQDRRSWHLDKTLNISHILTTLVIAGSLFAYAGGMDKRVFAKDRAAVDREIERLKPLVELGGYIPCPDHRIAPDAHFELVQYYCERFRKAFG